VTAPRILIVRTADSPLAGLVIAVMPPESPYISSARVVVGDVCRISRDDQPEKWRAWLWPVPGGALHVTRSCEAVDAAAPETLLDRLQKRADREPWWDRGDQLARPEETAATRGAV
jgi:hypothetical protein